MKIETPIVSEYTVEASLDDWEIQVIVRRNGDQVDREHLLFIDAVPDYVKEQLAERINGD
jgi:hypothetical protein